MDGHTRMCQHIWGGDVHVLPDRGGVHVLHVLCAVYRCVWVLVHDCVQHVRFNLCMNIHTCVIISCACCVGRTCVVRGCGGMFMLCLRLSQLL